MRIELCAKCGVFYDADEVNVPPSVGKYVPKNKPVCGTCARVSYATGSAMPDDASDMYQAHSQALAQAKKYWPTRPPQEIIDEARRRAKVLLEAWALGGKASASTNAYVDLGCTKLCKMCNEFKRYPSQWPLQHGKPVGKYCAACARKRTAARVRALRAKRKAITT